jgi:hypothetical protein
MEIALVSKRLVVMMFFPLSLPAAVAQLPPVPQTGDESAKKKPRLFVAQRVIDLGKVMEGDKVTLSWLLENHGSADLVIEKTTSSCGCAVVKLRDEDKVLRPGGTLDLKVVFDSKKRRGKQAKHVTVQSNDPTTAKLQLDFKANVDFLYDVKPSTLLNLQMLRRGEQAAKTLDITPGPGRSSVEIMSVEFDEECPLIWKHEPFAGKSGTGQRLKFTVKKDAALGRVKALAKIKLKVAGTEREYEVPLRGEIVGDLSVNPVVVDATRQTSRRGKQLAPVTLRSTNRTSFEVLGASAGPLLDVEIEKGKAGARETKYKFLMTIRDDAPPGPFGAALEIRTTSADQPVISVPVFGIVAPPIEVDPPVIIFRHDGTPAGVQRRLRVKASVQDTLEITDIKCDNQAVAATIDYEATRHRRHLLFLDVKLTGKPPAGTQETTLVLTTSIKGAERLEIPVRIEVPE